MQEIDQREKMSEEGEVVRSIGGLYVVGTERHESRRIDLQLRGRCGRQGDPGSSRFFLSLEDDLMRIFAGDFVKSMMERLGMKEGEAIESNLVTRRIAAAQKKVEERNYEIRKSLLDYDEVMDEQRKRVYRYRQNLLDGHSSRSMILDLIRAQIDKFVDTFLDPSYGVNSFAAYAGSQLDCQLESRDFINMDFQMASDYAHDQAERQAEVTVSEIVEENLPEGMEDEWNWKALAQWANSRQGANYQEHQLKNMDRQEMIDQLIQKSHARIAAVKLDEGAVMLEGDFGLRTLAPGCITSSELKRRPKSSATSMTAGQLPMHFSSEPKHPMRRKKPSTPCSPASPDSRKSKEPRYRSIAKAWSSGSHGDLASNWTLMTSV